MNALLIALVLSCPGKEGQACACNHDQMAEKAKAAPAASAPAANGAVLSRGEKLKGLELVAFEKLLASPKEFDGKTVALEAKVRKACTKKGCWMELASGDKGPGVRVTFKDYGFFVPLDSAGSTAKVEGLVKVAELSPEKAKHYESEGAMIAKDKDGKFREVQLVATGVELRK
ncbi:MAG: DUF4920 domain-containing protein [Myxococcota bacterium]